MTDKTIRIHPLHDIDWLAQCMRDTGCYPPVHRRTGRSTANALHAIATAIENPHTPVKVADHHGTTEADRHLFIQIDAIISQLGLQHLQLHPRQGTITFERAKSPAIPTSFLFPMYRDRSRM